MQAAFSLIQQGATLITANQRLARHLQQEFIARQMAQGRRVWPSADILPLSAWLRRGWDEYLDSAAPSVHPIPPLLLEQVQSQALWTRIIGESEEGKALLHVPATARSAAEAWRLLKQHRLPLPNKYADLHEDGRAYARWAQRYDQICAEHGWLDRDSLADFIAERLEQGLAVPARVLLAGFDEHTPQQRRLWDALRDAGTEVTELATPAVEAGRRVRIGLTDADSEVRAAAYWVRELLLQPDSGTIGVVVPDLNASRARIERIFTEALSPSALLTGEDTAALVNISLGRPLAETPLVADALLLLGLTGERLSLDDASRTLRSPFLGGAEQEFAHRALLDAHLRETGQPEVSLRTLIRLAQREGAACPLLAECLTALRQSVATSARELPPSVWTERFSQWLALLGWPGERTLDSDEYQAAVAWRTLLASFGAFDTVAGRQSLGEALAALRRLAVETVFQPQQEGARVQVLGVLEATGLRFDHLWVLGLHDEIWPPPPRPNPFLPVALQRDHRLPHASAERELAFCRRINARLLASSPDVIVSHPQRDGDRALTPSALISELPAVASVDLSPHPTAYAVLIHASRRVETLDDTRAPPLPEGFPVRGGASVFKHQAACPFRAFSVLRLGAVGVGQVQVGLSPRERGTLVHLALDALWQRLRSHAALEAMTEQAVRALSEEVAQTAVARAAAEDRDLFTPAFIKLEQQRLAELLQQWLVQEKARAPFTVLEREQAHTLSLGGLSVSARIDRIDRLADGRCVIIDYKTGMPNEADWFGPRPEEPQLPLYAVAMGRPLAAVLFGQVVRGNMRFRGVAASESIAPGIKPHDEHRHAREFPSWEAMIAGWQAVLTRLAQDFREGHAPVEPKDATTCRYCECAPLCRLYEWSGARFSEEQGGGDE